MGPENPPVSPFGKGGAGDLPGIGCKAKSGQRDFDVAVGDPGLRSVTYRKFHRLMYNPPEMLVTGIRPPIGSLRVQARPVPKYPWLPGRLAPDAGVEP